MEEDSGVRGDSVGAEGRTFNIVGRKMGVMATRISIPEMIGGNGVLERKVVGSKINRTT